MEKKTFKTRRLLIFIIPLAFVMALTIGFLIYSVSYYRADMTALAALNSDDLVSVSETDYGWFFDGPSQENILVFYPGAKVEETAYAPILHHLAENNLDVCLVSMPRRFAILGINKADSVLQNYEYARCFIGGHSLGGAMASEYASKHEDKIDGVILLAAYASGELDDDMLELIIYGTEDRIVSKDKIEDGRETATDHYIELCIEGGNHAQFGNYGAQSGDGTALITAEEQQSETIRMIVKAIRDYE